MHQVLSQGAVFCLRIPEHEQLLQHLELKIKRNIYMRLYIQHQDYILLGNSIGIPHTRCGRFKKHVTQWESEFQVDKLFGTFT